VALRFEAPRSVRLAAGLAAILTVGGCMVGPNYHRPAPPQAAGYAPGILAPEVTGAAAQSFEPGADIPGQWWALFQSPALNRLVEQSLKANPDLQAAQAALRAARETYLAQRGALFPSVDASYNVTRQQASVTLAPPLTSNEDLFTLHTAQLSVSYVPDVFGGVRRQTETVAAQAEAQRFETEAAYLTLTSNLVAAAIQEASLRDQIAATRKVIALSHEVLKLLRSERAAGQIGSADVAAQETALAQAEQALPPLERQLAQTLDLIAALTGRFPSDARGDDLGLSSLTLPMTLPVSLPSRLVEQRPDVRVAEANLHAASAQVGVAVANRLPSFMLSANAGGASTDIASLLSRGNGFWSLGATVTQPIFQGGTLLHRQRAAEAQLDQAEAQYRSTVITALQNVADALQALRADERALGAADKAQIGAAASLTIARRQLELGEAGTLPVLAAEQADLQALISRTQALSSQYADTAALFQALGGGWWNRTDVQQEVRR